MPVNVRSNFTDALDPRFREIATEEFQKPKEDMLPHIWGMPGPTQPFRDTERYSEVSGLPIAGQFTGSIDYASFYQGYDTTASYVEFAQGVQVERTLVEWDQKNIIEERPRALARAAWRRRQRDGLRFLRNAFSVDTFFHNRTEGVALCSNSHTTTSGTATTSGFDNLVTTALTAPNLASMQIQASDIRDLQSEPVEVVIDTLIVPIDLYETAWEIVSSMGKVDVSTNNRNVHFGAYTLIFLRNKLDFSDTNDWFGADGTLMKDLALWFDQVWPPENGFTEEFDTLVAKYRSYFRYTNLLRDWRFLIGAQVS